ncbi:MAG TPA: hypothetical protein VJ911_04305 [Cryomorphaceae bacterium]|nr:hypothetical protein [Cryomorphaceae bacterium]
MKEDIIDPVVEDIAIAAVPEQNETTGEDEWFIYLINLKSVDIENVIIASKGYGEIEKEKVETSQLRHYVEKIPANGFAKVEPIMDDLFGLSNQYWVSFYVGKEIFDKKYVFVAESIQSANLSQVPLMDKKGVLLR